jgi:CheY-like chemotaxis protein
MGSERTANSLEEGPGREAGPGERETGGTRRLPCTEERRREQRPLPPSRERAALSEPFPSPDRAAGLCRILIIEDNEDAAQTLQELLELSGYEVEVAYTGREGFAAARQLRPDLVICDIGLPGMDGYAVARALREDPGTASIVLVAVSGYGRQEDQEQGAEAGFDVYLVKPVDPKYLLEVIAEGLEG